MKRIVAAALLATGLGGAALAHHVGEITEAGDIRVSHAWTEETARMAHAAEVFLTIKNVGEAPDRLIAARTDFAQPGVFQASVLTADGALAVAEVPAVQVAPGQMITFQPSGVHIVLNGLQRELLAGQHFEMELETERAGTFTVEVEIEEHEEHDEPAA